MDKALILWMALAIPCFGQGILPPILGVPPGPPPVHTFSFLHANTNTGCPVWTATACTVTVTSTTAGSLLTIWLTSSTTGTLQITSVTCSPNACNSGSAAYTHCSNCYFKNANNDTVDGGFVLAVPSGVTSVVVNYASGHTDQSFAIAEVDEISYTGGGVAALDNFGGAALAACTTCAATGVTITGTKDYVSRDWNTPNSVTAPGAPWTNPGDIATTGVIGALNQANASTFNISQTSGAVAQAVMAFQ